MTSFARRACAAFLLLWLTPTAVRAQPVEPANIAARPSVAEGEATGAHAEPTSMTTESGPSLKIPIAQSVPIRQAPPPVVPTKSIAAASSSPMKDTANTIKTPHQILRTHIDLDDMRISDNSRALAEQLNLIPLLTRIQNLRASVKPDAPLTLQTLDARQQLTEAIQEAHSVINETNLAVDFTVAEITAEDSVYEELLAHYQAEANKIMQWTNWGSFYSNGALWAVAEALDIPTWKRPKYSIGSGINGILAGVVPSFASLYAMHAAGGRKHSGERDPNMLSKIFIPSSDEPDIDYPAPVWKWLNSVPPGEIKTRRDQLIDRWITDKNLPDFTDLRNRTQIEHVTALAPTKRVTISLLETRRAMLTQLAAEILKMKRLLYELSLVAHGEKQISSM
jgi:hypothetical protein